MTITTEEYWDVDGTDLNNLAWNISTLGGRSGLAPLRGENIKVPYRQGQVWVPKNLDSRTITLAMWVRGSDENGLYPTNDTDLRDQFNTNWRALKKLFAPRRRQLEITKRWREGGELLEATCLAERGSTMEPEMIGRGAARFAVDLLLADPFFYADVVPSGNIAIDDTVTVTHPGDDEVTRATIQIVGPVFNGRLTNTTNGIYVQVNNSVDAGQTVTLDTDLFTAVSTDGTNRVADVVHDGDPRWMILAEGDNDLEFTAYSGTGHASISFRPPYF